ncbi:MAG: hypothetical protein V3T88_00715, partial [Nitrosomonadaceae bacterium]
VYVTPDQKAATVAKFLYQGYISIFGAPAKLLSDRGANFTSNIISELCKMLGVAKVQTTAYHAQTNGQVERMHQTIMRMLGKLNEDKKADWPSHLSEVMQAYNSTRSAVTGYSPHYLMFGRKARTTVDFLFPTIRNADRFRKVDEYVVTVRDRLREAYKEAQAQSTLEAARQKRYYDRGVGTVELKPGDLVLVKADAYQGKRKIKNRWNGQEHEVLHQVATGVPSYVVKDGQDRQQTIHRNRLLLLATTEERGLPLGIDVNTIQAKCTSITPIETTPLGSEVDDEPQEVNGRSLTLGLTSENPLGWIDGKRRHLPWTRTGVSQKENG